MNAPTPGVAASKTDPELAGTIHFPVVKSRPAMLHEAPRTPPDVTAAFERSTISWLLGSMLAVMVNARSESGAVSAATGAPGPGLVPMVQFDDCRVCPGLVIASTVAS